ncbi:hypothetical protein AB0I84_10910 [Streptomyces spectabilis]|uniref:hypothetical protein n=1 Tax=Streptomyces spectabilis TaxID=68270 RepID=UPI0033C3DC69
MDHAPSRRLAADAHRIFRDPDSARTVVIDTTHLPDSAAAQLTGALTPGRAGPKSPRPLRPGRPRRPPLGVTGACLGTWPALTGPAWCATAPGAP